MKSLLLVLLTIAAVLILYKNKPEPPVAPIPVESHYAQVSPTPTPKPTPQLAPQGVFYLVQPVRIETDSGITGLPPGTGVKLLHDDLYLTPAGETHLAAVLLTNDMGIAREARDADRSAQAAAQSAISADAAAAKARQTAADSATPSPEAQALQSAARSGGTAVQSTDLNTPHDGHSYTDAWAWRYHRYYYDTYGHIHYY